MLSKNHVRSLVYSEIALGLLVISAVSFLAGPLSASAQVATSTVHVVVSVNGGANDASDFTLSATGANAAPGSFSGSTSGTDVTVDVGSPYSISVPTLISYTASSSPDCTSTSAANAPVTCTVVFDSVTPFIPGVSDSNLISNPSLETPNGAVPLDWNMGFNPGNASYGYPVDGVGGGVAASTTIASTSPAADAKWYFKPVSVIPGHTYVFQDAYKSNIQSELAIEYLDANHQHLSFAGFTAVPASADWDSAGVTFIPPSASTSTPAAAYVTIFHRIQNVGWLAIDNAALTETPPPLPFPHGFVSFTFDDALKSQAENTDAFLHLKGLKGTYYILTHVVSGLSIPNANLESGSTNAPSEWSNAGSTATSTTYSYPVVGHAGSAAEVSSTLAGSNAAWYFNPITVTPDIVYSFSFWYKSTASSTLVAQVTNENGTMETADVSTDTGGFISKTLALPSTAGVWTQINTHFYMPAQAATLTVMSQLTGVGSLTVDDVTLGAPGHMTIGDVQSLADNNHEIGGHTRTHLDLTALTSVRAQDEIAGSAQDLAQFTPRTFAYPYGAHNAAVDQLTQNAGYTSGRTIVSGFDGVDAPKFGLFSQSVNADTTLDQVKAWVNQAKADHLWLILTFHDVQDNLTNTPFGTKINTFQSIVNYVRDTAQLPVLTVSEGIAYTATPTLGITVDVQNTHGGIATSSDVTLSVTGNSSSQTTVIGSPTPVAVTFNSGAYAVTASSTPANYTVVLSSECAGSITNGETKSCVVTLTDPAPTDTSSSGGSSGRRRSGGGGAGVPQVLGASTTTEAVVLPSLTIGAYGDEVRALQEALMQGGFLHIAAATGYFGPLTAEAVSKFQIAHGLPGTGVADSATRTLLAVPASPYASMTLEELLALLEKLKAQLAELIAKTEDADNSA